MKQSDETQNMNEGNKSTDSRVSPAEHNDGNVGSTAAFSLRILEQLASRDEEHGVTYLAEELGVPKARIHRHLTALRAEGYVVQNQKTSRYRIGWRLFLLAQKLVKQFSILNLAHPLMEELRDAVGQTIVISSFTENNVVVLDLVRGLSPLGILLHTGTHFDLHSVAQGKIALAFGPTLLKENTLKSSLKAYTEHTITQSEQLAKQLELVKSRGWADAPEEIFLGVNAIAAPIFQGDGSLFGAIAIVGSIHYLPYEPEVQTIQYLTDTAQKISLLLGATEQ